MKMRKYAMPQNLIDPMTCRNATEQSGLLMNY
jgi:hypothetical protein